MAAFVELAADVAAMDWSFVKMAVLFGCAAVRHTADVAPAPDAAEQPV